MLSPLTSHGSEPYVIEENSKGDSQRVIDMDHVHGSSIWAQNRVQLREKLSRSYENLLELI